MATTLFSKQQTLYPELLRTHVDSLSRFARLAFHEPTRRVIVCDLLLPPGYNVATTAMLIELPPDYPLIPPGVGEYRIYLDPGLRFQGKELRDLHEDIVPEYATAGFGPWAYFCYEHIRWQSGRDDLIRFLELVRTDLTNPPTH